MSNEKIIAAEEPNNTENSVPENIHHLERDLNELLPEDRLLDSPKDAKSVSMFFCTKPISSPEEKPSAKLKKIIEERIAFENKNPFPPYSTHKTDINYLDIDGKNLLHYAVEEGNLDEVKRLIDECGADINCKTAKEVRIRKQPIKLALRTGQIEIAKYLYEREAHWKDIPAVAAKKGPCREWFYNIIIKSKNDDSYYSYSNRAAETGDINYFEEKEARGVDLDCCNSTILNLAAANGQLKTVEYLLLTGCSINPPNKYSDSALHVAVENGEYETIKYLLSKGADINWQDQMKETPLMVAIEKKDEELVQYLLKNNPNTNLTNILNDTVLHKAIIADNLPIFCLLKDHCDKSLLSVKNIYGETVLDLAKKYQNGKIIELLDKSVASRQEKSSKVEISQAKMVERLSYYMRSHYRDMDFFSSDGYCNGLTFKEQNDGDSFYEEMSYICQWDGYSGSSFPPKDIPRIEQFIYETTWFLAGTRFFEKQWKEEKGYDESEALSVDQHARLEQYLMVSRNTEGVPNIIYTHGYIALIIGEGPHSNEEKLKEITRLFFKMPAGARLELHGAGHTTGAYIDIDSTVKYYESNLPQKAAPIFIDNPDQLAEVIINTKYIPRGSYNGDFDNHFLLFYRNKDKDKFLSANYHIFSENEFPTSKENAMEIYQKSPNKLTHLHIAIMTHSLASLKKLLQDDYCEINAKNAINETPLEIAVRNGFTEASMLLLEHPHINLTNHPAAELAYRNNNHAVLNKIITHPNSRSLADLLMRAILNKDHQLVDQLITTQKAEVNDQQNTPLFFAVALAENEIIVRYLLENNAKIISDTPVMSSVLEEVIRDHNEYWGVLLEYMKDVNQLDNHRDWKCSVRRDAAIHYAAEYAKENILQSLIEKQANFRLKNSCNESVIEILTRFSEDEDKAIRIFQTILPYYQLNLKNDEDIQSLHRVLKVCMSSCNLKVKIFDFVLGLSNNEVLDQYDDDAGTLLHDAVLNENYDFAAKLINAGANINSQTKTTMVSTPLHILVRFRSHIDEKFFQLFFENNVRIDIPDGKGKTVMDYVDETDNPQLKSIFNEYQDKLRIKFK